MVFFSFEKTAQEHHKDSFAHLRHLYGFEILPIQLLMHAHIHDILLIAKTTTTTLRTVLHNNEHFFFAELMMTMQKAEKNNNNGFVFIYLLFSCGVMHLQFIQSAQ
jgi:hypothetical protein